MVQSNGDLIAEPDRTNRVDEWLTTRGLHPDKLVIEPFAQSYHNVVKTLENAGYVQGQDLFVSTWDWRTPVAPVDNVNDGSLTASFADITDATFDTGLDYLAHTIQEAKSANPTATAVDLITHSTGGLVARAYVQSTAYADRANNGLLSVNNLIMAGVS